MYKGIDGDYIFEQDVVKAPDGRVWWVEKFTNQGNEDVKAVCRNGNCFTHWSANQLKSILYT